MTDDADDDLPEVEVEVDTDSRAEWHEYSGGPNGNGGAIIFPYGSDVFAEKVNALAIRIADKTGEIEILAEVGKPWREVHKATRPAAVESIK